MHGCGIKRCLVNTINCVYKKGMLQRSDLCGYFILFIDHCENGLANLTNQSS